MSSSRAAGSPADYLGWPPQKAGGRYLALWLADVESHSDLTPPSRGLDVEIALPREWQAEPMAMDPLGAAQHRLTIPRR